jgi:hypothetical protein
MNQRRISELGDSKGPPSSQIRAWWMPSLQSFFCFFQLPNLGPVWGADVGINKLQDLAVIGNRRCSLTLFLIR